MSEDKIDEKPGRDEKGLTLSHRALLRVVMEYSHAMAAAVKINDSIDFRDIVDNPIILSRLQDLITFGLMMGKKIGTMREVEDYLRSHENADEEFFQNQKANVFKSLIESDLDKLHGMLMTGPACEACGKQTCVSCKKCHSCEIAPTLN